MSFAPSFSSFPDLPEPGPSTRPQPPTRKSHRREKDKSKDKKERRARQPDADQFERDLKEKQQEAEAARRVSEEERTTQLLFFEDRKGDDLNVAYGGVHAGDVPKYKLVGRGSQILGLGAGWRANYRSAKGVEVGIGPRRKMPRITDKESRALLAAAPTKRIQKADEPYKYDEIDGFLRLPSRRVRQVQQAYRSIIPTTRAADNTDSDNSSESDGSTSDDGVDVIPYNSQQQRIKQLEARTRTEPTSVEAWLEFVDATVESTPVGTPNATLARATMSLSILEKALEKGQNIFNQTLRLKYIAAGEEIWSASDLEKEWDEVLKLGGADVWMAWFEWRMRSVGEQWHTIVQDANRAISSLEREAGSQAEVELSQLRLFWRAAVALRDAGDGELATALFQAQAELTFKLPQALDGLSFIKQLNGLEDFWESEASRLGEPDAQGWDTWHAAGCPIDVLRPPLTPPSSLSSPTSRGPFEWWASREIHSDQAQRFPVREEAESVDADPYSVVLFAELEPLLFPLQSTQAKTAFRMVWLSMIGLHIPGFSTDLDARWSYSHLTSPAYLDSVFPSKASQKRPMAEAYAGVVIGREKEYFSGFGPIKEWSTGVVRPLDHVVSGWGMWTREDVKDVDAGYAQRLFAQLRSGSEEAEWDMLALAFEAAVSLKSAIKLSKTLLSASRNSLPHWAAHAKLERMRGRVAEARKIYRSALVVGPIAQGSACAGQLWWDWAEMEWLNADSPDHASLVVTQSTNLRGKDIPTILRVRSHLEDVIKLAPHRNEREAWINLAALFELLQHQSIHSAVAVFDQYILDAGGGPKQASPHHEGLTVACLRMIYDHSVTLKRPTPTSLIRERLERAIKVYPSNTVILAMFLEGEKGQGVWGRVRGLLGEGDGGKAKRKKDVVRCIVDVWIAGWERGRWESEIERTRVGLASAVMNDRTKGSAVLWRVYVEFEIRVGNLQRARSVLFRAIGECPLNKELYLLAFGPLRQAFSARELQRFVDTMALRGVRMRRDLDADVGSSMLVNDEFQDSDEDLDELECKANELRRLRPF